MILNKVLSSLGQNQYGELVKADDGSAQLEAVDQEQGQQRPVLPGLVQKVVLQVFRFHHGKHSFFLLVSHYSTLNVLTKAVETKMLNAEL